MPLLLGIGALVARHNFCSWRRTRTAVIGVSVERVDMRCTPILSGISVKARARSTWRLLIDGPRYVPELARWFRDAGGIAHVLLSHRDDVADAHKYAQEFGARLWIHRDDASAAPYAIDLLEGRAARMIAPGVRAIPVPGHTRGSVVYLIDDEVLFSGDSLAWSAREQDLVAFKEACWYSWTALTASLGDLGGYRFEWLLPGHGWPVHLPADEMQGRLRALVGRMAAES